MKPPFNARAPTFDPDAVQATIQRALAAAGLDTRKGPMRELTQTLQRTLGGTLRPTAPPVRQPAKAPAPAHAPGAGAGAEAAVAAWWSTAVFGTPSAQSGVVDAAGPATATQPAGSFEAHAFSSDAGRRSFKLYVPAAQATQAASPAAAPALLVMLHGCTQSADDFAAGTQMNRLADEHGFLVVYPEQAAQANSSKCWNWFQPQDQGRDAGEPALIAGIVRQVAQQHGADPQRIFVAGLSAGAAMAVVLGQTHPELFAGVGAHSGLPFGSAHDVSSALSAMKGGRSGLPGMNGATSAPRRGKAPAAAAVAVPTIVFHGDRDHTVQHSNGVRIAQQACDAHALHASPAAQAGDLGADTESGVAAGGRRYTRTVHSDPQGRVCVESWTLHGAGHAWSGGDASGSYTDGSGPDASAEMLRFFSALPGPPSTRRRPRAAKPD